MSLQVFLILRNLFLFIVCAFPLDQLLFSVSLQVLDGKFPLHRGLSIR